MRKRVLLDEFHVQMFVPPGLSAKKAREIRQVAELVLRSAGKLIEHLARAHTKSGDVVVRTEK